MPDTPIVHRLRRLLAEAQKALEAAEALPAPGRRSPSAPPAPAGAGRPFTPLELARGMLGVMEAAGEADNPQVVAFLRACRPEVTDDEVPWCSAFVSWCCKVTGFERSRSLRARSWLDVGADVRGPADARPGDVVVFSRGRLPQPGPEVRRAPGHVAFVAEAPAPGATRIKVVGGNQGDRVSEKRYPTSRVLGFRRLGPGRGRA